MPGADMDVEVLTLEKAAAEYLAASVKKLEQRDRVAVARFVSWCGANRLLTEITAHEMTLFQEAQGANVADLAERLLPIKAFLAHAKRRGWSPTNLGVHLRVKKRTVKSSSATTAQTVTPDDGIEITAEGLEASKAELQRLKSERQHIVKDLELAMADKDFRENAPLDAARDAQAHLESRIRELEHQIAQAVVVDPAAAVDRGRAHLGSDIAITNLVSNETVQYTLVGQNEADMAVRRISVVSPVGQALVGKGVGDVVSVAVPLGTIRFRVESIDGFSRPVH